MSAVAFSPDGKTLASASDDGTMRLWDAATGESRATLKGHEGRVSAVAFSPTARPSPPQAMTNGAAVGRGDGEARADPQGARGAGVRRGLQPRRQDPRLRKR